jgi:hypothetical protein
MACERSELYLLSPRATFEPPCYEGARRELASFIDAVPHSRRAPMLEPTAEQVQAHPAGLRQAGGGSVRQTRAISASTRWGEKPPEV